MGNWKDLMVGDGSQFGGKGAPGAAGPKAFGGGEPAKAKTVSETVSKKGNSSFKSNIKGGKFGADGKQKPLVAGTKGSK